MIFSYLRESLFSMVIENDWMSEAFPSAVFWSIAPTCASRVYSRGLRTLELPFLE